MATTKLDKKSIEALAALGIKNVTTEEQARPKVEKILAEQDIDGLDDMKFKDLLDMASVMGANDSSDEDEEEVVDEDEEEVLEDEDDEEEEVVAPKTKAKAKTAPAKGKKTQATDEDADDLAEEVETKNLKAKPAKAAAKVKSDNSNRKRKLLGKHWENLSDDEKTKALAKLRKVLPANKYRFDMLQRSITVKYIGKSSEQNIFKYHLLRLLDNGLEGVFVAHRLKTIEELRDYLPDNGEGRTVRKGDSVYMHPLSENELLDILKNSDFLQVSIDRAIKQDQKMKQNRDKLESSLKNNKANEVEEEEEEVVVETKKAGSKKEVAAKVDPKSAKKTVTKAVKQEVEETDDDDEEEVVIEQPTKGVKGLKTAPKTSPAAAKTAPKSAPAKATTATKKSVKK